MLALITLGGVSPPIRWCISTPASLTSSKFFPCSSHFLCLFSGFCICSWLLPCSSYSSLLPVLLLCSFLPPLQLTCSSTSIFLPSTRLLFHSSFIAPLTPPLLLPCSSYFSPSLLPLLLLCSSLAPSILCSSVDMELYWVEVKLPEMAIGAYAKYQSP